MLSQLKWRTGIDAKIFVLLAAFLVLVFFQTGLVRAFGIAMCVPIAIYAVQQFRRWNAPGWNQVHFRGVFAYRAFLKRGASPAEARHDLAETLSQAEEPARVEALLRDVDARKGRHLADLIQAHGRELLPELTPEQFETVLARLKSDEEPGPEVVIARIVERDFGEEEAARYVVALLKQQAY
jgi:hypothetical protein